MLQHAGKDAGKDDESESEAEAQGPQEPRWKEARREKRKQSRQEVTTGLYPIVRLLSSEYVHAFSHSVYFARREMPGAPVFVCLRPCCSVLHSADDFLNRFLLHVRARTGFNT